LRAFDMWESHPVATPLDPNVRLSKLDCPIQRKTAALSVVSRTWLT
jgi:hypothetical protein